ISARPIAPAEPLAAVLPLLGLLLLRALVHGGIVTSFRHLLVAVFVFELVVSTAARVLLLEAGAVLAKYPEVVVGELQIVFGLNAVPSQLRITRHALVFLEQLGGIAALPVVLPIAGLSADILSALPTATATAATLTIIDQIP